MLAVGLLALVLLVGVLVSAYMISRDPGSDFLEHPNPVEANHFRNKLGRYENALTNGQNGFVRFSQLEINSYIRQTLTNNADTNTPGMHLRRVGVGLNSTNLTLYSWGEYRAFNLPLRFVVQRGFRIQQEGANQWEMPMEWMKVGEVEVPKRFWDSVGAELAPLDEPVKEAFAWRTNIQAMLVRKNELSQRPELRLYTYKPIPAEDLH
jgi:hypothetical protein